MAPTQRSSDSKEPPSAPDQVHAELKEKLASRQELLRSQPHTPSSNDSILTTPVPPHQQQQQLPSASQPTDPVVPASLPAGYRPGMMATSAGDMQFQLQFLQQQFLQQQMMQLQQQFSQLQHSIHQPQPAAMAMLPTSSLYPHPHQGVVAMPLHPVMGPSVAMPPAGPVNMLGHPHVPPQVSNHSPHLVGTPPPGAPLLTSTPTSHTQGMPCPAKQQSSSDIRSGALGELESQFDRLMQDVRETDPADLLKKVSGPSTPPHPW